MCRLCEGNEPNENDFNDFKAGARRFTDRWAKRGDASTSPQFVRDAVNLDALKRNSGVSWGNPDYRQTPIRLIFRNPDPHRGLLLYVLFIWIDIQQRSRETVGHQWIIEMNDWLDGRRSTSPREDFAPVGPHLKRIRQVAGDHSSLSEWFVATITDIATHSGQKPGNVYRFAGRVFAELLEKDHDKLGHHENQEWRKLQHGQPAFLGEWKRMWVLLRSLRRDNSVVRCLFTRALSAVEQGGEALGYWYNDGFYNPTECQLPVDTVVWQNWVKVMRGNGIGPKVATKREIAKEAMELAARHGVSPSVFDVLWAAGGDGGH